SGAAVARHAPNRDNAVKLLEYLVSDEAQSLYARANYEYPVKAGVELDPVVASFGAMKVDALPLTEVARHRRQASELVDKVGFDHGRHGGRHAPAADPAADMNAIATAIVPAPAGAARSRPDGWLLAALLVAALVVLPLLALAWT